MEYEIKLRVDNLKGIRDKLIACGWRPFEVVEEIDSYVDLSPCVGIPHEDIALRIRKRKELENGSETGEITYKGPVLGPDVKAREEITSQVGDPDSLVKVFVKLGFRIYRIRKRREIFKKEDSRVLVYLDSVKDLGDYVEIEEMNPASKEEFLASVKDIKEKLGLHKEPNITTPYLKILISRMRKK